MNKKIYLATTALEETWDTKADKIVFLGSQCKLYPKREQYESNKYVNLPILWDSQEKIEDAAKTCKVIFEKKLEEMTAVYNDIFNINENKLYYNRIFGYWLLDFINKVYDSYHSLIHAFEIYPSLYTSVLSENKYQIPNDYQDYVSGSIDDMYSYQLYSQIVNILNLKCSEIDITLDFQLSSDSSVKKINKKSIFLKYISYYLNKIFQKKKVIITSPYFNKTTITTVLKLLIKSKFKIIFDNMEYNLNTVSEDDIPRYELYDKLALFQTDSFGKLLSKMISLNIPKIYFEKFSSMRKIVSQDIKRDADIYFTANAHYGNEYFKYKVANNGGAKYLIMQHGGGYGIFKLNFGEYWETQIADKFYSFGWSNKQNIKYLAPSKFVYTPHNINKNSSGDILYITNTISRYLRHFNGYGFFGDGSEELYIKSRSRFLDSLDKNIKIKLRMYPKDHYKLYEKQRIIDEKYKNIIFDDYKNDFLSTLLSCKLHITDITMTTFLEALFNNIPTVCFSKALENNISDMSKKSIQRLVKANILFFDEKRAAEHINNIYLDIDTWWNQDTVQKAKNDFINQFAKKSFTLEADWVEEFNKVLKEN